jgi:hypothetical protein
MSLELDTGPRLAAWLISVGRGDPEATAIPFDAQ